MGTFLKYPELATLPRRPEILAVKEVIATEKLHGTNFRVFFPEGISSVDEVRFGGRNEVFASHSDGFYRGRPVRWFRDRPDLLARMLVLVRERGYSDVTVFGEACGAGIQKGVRYVPDDRVVFRAFDLAIGENLVTWDVLRDAGHQLGDGMQDMKLLVPAVIADLHKECEAEWQAVLATGCSDGDVRGAASRALARVYRRLLEEAA